MPARVPSAGHSHGLPPYGTPNKPVISVRSASPPEYLVPGAPQARHVQWPQATGCSAVQITGETGSWNPLDQRKACVFGTPKIDFQSVKRVDTTFFRRFVTQICTSC